MGRGELLKKKEPFQKQYYVYYYILYFVYFVYFVFFVYFPGSPDSPDSIPILGATLQAEARLPARGSQLTRAERRAFGAEAPKARRN